MKARQSFGALKALFLKVPVALYTTPKKVLSFSCASRSELLRKQANRVRFVLVASQLCNFKTNYAIH